MSIKISQLPVASALTGTELIPVVQGGVTAQAPASAFVGTGVAGSAGVAKTGAATYAAARLLAGTATGDTLYVFGRTTQSDGGQGLFTWVVGGSTTIDDGVELQATGGIWRRADTSFVTYEMFGAVPMTSFADVSHDSTAAITACHLAFPSITTAKQPFRVLLQGFYGISATINFLKLSGIEFVGVANFAELGSGYIWIGALSNATHSLYFSGNRYLKMRRLRVAANSETLTRANAMLSAICLASDYTTQIQERCTFEDIVIGGRDTYDGQSSGLDYQFISGFTGEQITGTKGNNDFHLFESVRQQNVGIGWNNQDSQSVCWVIRNSKVWASDTFASLGSTTITFYDIEADTLRGAAFIIGQSGSDSNIVRIHGYTNELNFAETAIINGDCSLSIERAGFDSNISQANHALVNATNPYFITATTAGTCVITLEQCKFFTIPPVIDFGTTTSLKHLIVKGGRPNTIAIRNDYVGMGQDQRIIYHWEPGAGTWQLTDADWAPINALLYPPYTSVAISGVTITGTAGQFAGTLSGFKVGQYLRLSGTYGGTGSITGYANPTTYYVSATNGTSTFTLTTLAGVALVTTAGTPTGITYTPSIAADPLISEICVPTMRVGRRNVSACIDVKTIATNAANIGAGATFTFANALPVGLILGVSLHVASPPPGPTSINIGDGTTAARWGNRANSSSLVNNPPEASTIAGFTDTSPYYQKTVGNVVLTGVGGAFSGGGSTITLTVHYIDFAQKYYNPDFSG